jgi:hypothetical protein
LFDRALTAILILYGFKVSHCLFFVLDDPISRA